jgi:hypothetical protein
MKKILKILLVLLIIYLVAATVSTFIGNQEIRSLIEKGVLDSEYTQQELSQLCNEGEVDIFWGCITGGVW